MSKFDGLFKHSPGWKEYFLLIVVIILLVFFAKKYLEDRAREIKESQGILIAKSIR